MKYKLDYIKYKERKYPDTIKPMIASDLARKAISHVSLEVEKLPNGDERITGELIVLHKSQMDEIMSILLNLELLIPSTQDAVNIIRRELLEM